MNTEQLSRATWHQNSNRHFKWHWSAGAQVGVAETRHTAMRRARKALQ